MSRSMSQPEPKAWERQPTESAQAYAAFRAYLELPPRKRSIDEAAKAVGLSRGAQEGRQRGARAPSRVWVWSAQHRWIERVAAWDAHVDAEDFAERLDEAKAWRKTKRQASGAFAAKMINVLRSVDFDSQSASEFIRNWRTISALRDEALGIEAAAEASSDGPGIQAGIASAVVPDQHIDRFEASPEMIAAVIINMAKFERAPAPEESAIEPELPGEPQAIEPTAQEPGPVNQTGDGPHES
jgi:hypothetical protein